MIEKIPEVLDQLNIENDKYKKQKRLYRDIRKAKNGKSLIINISWFDGNQRDAIRVDNLDVILLILEMLEEKCIADGNVCLKNMEEFVRLMKEQI